MTSKKTPELAGRAGLHRRIHVRLHSAHRWIGRLMTVGKRIRVLRLSPDSRHWRGDAVVVEEPLRIHIRHGGRVSLLGATMRTPGNDHELAVGLALAEGAIRARGDVSEVRHCAGDGRYSESDVLVALRDGVRVDDHDLGRVSHPSSACGMCGRDQIDALLVKVPDCRSGVVVPSDVIRELPGRMMEKQAVFRRTGGLHAVGLATRDGRLLAVREDVGRHNAMDKVIGAAVLDDLRGDVLVVSGRVGFEIVQKAAMASVPMIAAVSAPTSLAVDAARDAGLTLVAFVRDGRLTVYSGVERIADVDRAAAW